MKNGLDKKDVSEALQELALANVYITAFAEVLRETIRDLPKGGDIKKALGPGMDRKVRQRYGKLKKAITIEAASRVAERMSKECDVKH